jgi:uncharacterized protein YkwD
VHHAPAGPRLLSRVAGLLARLRYRTAALLAPLTALALVLQRTRILSVALTALALGAFVLAAPLAPYDDEARSTAALTSDADGGLIPATGDGWTQDGVPAPSSTEEEPAASSSAGGSSSAGRPSPAAVDDADETSSASTSSPASSAAATSSSGSSSSTGTSSSSSPRPPSSGSAASSAPEGTASGTPSGTPEETPEVEEPVADPAAQVLALVNTARVAAGCAALSADAGLDALAAEHSVAMRDGGWVDVRSPDDGGAPLDRGDRTAVVASGTDPAVVAAGWAADADLLDCELDTAGIGTTDGYWTLVAA